MAHVKRFLSDKFGQVDISHSIRVFMDPEDSPEPEAPRMRRASWMMPPPTDMLENKFSSSNRKRRWEDTPIPSQQVTVEIARSPLGTLAVVVEERFSSNLLSSPCLSRLLHVDEQSAIIL